MSRADQAAAAPRRVLGVDPGLKRTGLALSDPLGLSVRPLDNLSPKSRAEDIDVLVGLCREHGVEAVVIGHPVLPRSGDETPWSRRVRGFAQALRERLDDEAAPLDKITVHLVNEVGSSQQAAQRLVASGVKKSRRKAALEAEAARLLVEAFLQGDRGEEVPHIFPSGPGPAT